MRSNKELKDRVIDSDTKVHIATVQSFSFVKRLFYRGDDTQLLTADEYNCIIVDEYHRGYLLDQEG